jgi:filamentous hemagglutinin family protein
VFFMRHYFLRLLAFLAISFPICAGAQVSVPDNTLPNPSIVTVNGNNQLITGGTAFTRNLFHSFSQFSVSEGGVALFEHASSIENLFVRVTGSSISNINGTLQTRLSNSPSQQGSANLFLLNPNGIVFGASAKLNLGGSFIASTADSIRFADGKEFSARQPESPLLTIGVPIGLQIGQNPGKILNQASPFPGLKVPNGKNIALIGGDIEFIGGNLSSGSGKIEVAAIGQNGIISTDLSRFIFDYSNSPNLRDIRLTAASKIQSSGNTIGMNLRGRIIAFEGSTLSALVTLPTSDRNSITVIATDTFKLTGASRIVSTTGTQAGASILVQARNLQMAAGSNIFTTTQGAGKGGNITINVDTEILADGYSSGFYTNSIGTAQGGTGNIIATSNALTLSNGAQINSITDTNTSGKSGNIAIAVDKIKITGAAEVPSVRPSVISTETNGTGNAGNLAIVTDQLQVLSGGQIITTTNRVGNAGQLTIQAKDIQVAGVAQSSSGKFLTKKNPDGSSVRLSSSITANTEPKSTGQGANVDITTDRLTVRDGAVIQSATFGSGDAGNINIAAQQSILLQGVAPNPQDPFPSSIIAFSGGIPNRNVLSIPDATGKGGNITIATPKLTLTDGAIIALGSLNATAQAKGAGDRLKITADVISLNNAELNAQTNAGNGGTFDLTANQLLFLRNGSKIITQAGGLNQDGNAGNISITSPLIVARKSENSDINANASKGNGGNIFITAKSIVGLEIRPRLTEFSDITASSDRGVQGTITLNSPKIDPDRGTLSLPIVPNDPSNRIDQTCSPNSSVASQFTVSGNGGLPAIPQTDRSLSLPPRLASLPKDSLMPQNTTFSKELNPIQEAQGMQRLADGKIRLLADEERGAVMIGSNQHCR